MLDAAGVHGRDVPSSAERSTRDVAAEIGAGKPKGVDKSDADQERTEKRETISASAEKRDNEDTVGDESALDRHNGKIKESKKYQRHWKGQGID